MTRKELESLARELKHPLEVAQDATGLHEEWEEEKAVGLAQKYGITYENIDQVYRWLLYESRTSRPKALYRAKEAGL